LLALVNVRKSLVLVAVHAHPGCVVTESVPPPATAETVVLVGLIEYEQVAGAPACDSVNVLPPIVAVAIRVLVLVFAGTL
jgi:hypothetical protein